VAVLRRGDIYGAGAGPSALTDAHPIGIVYQDDVLREAQPPVPVTPKVGGMQVGQFTLAEAAVGLILLIASIVVIDHKVIA